MRKTVIVVVDRCVSTATAASLAIAVLLLAAGISITTVSGVEITTSTARSSRRSLRASSSSSQQKTRRRNEAGATADDDDEALFSLCDADDYYDGIINDGPPSSWTWDDLQQLLESTHRRSLPYTSRSGSSGDDVWEALKDVDRGGGDDEAVATVRLIYSQKDVPAEPKGTPATWNREHLWPKSLGVFGSGPDWVDVHHLFPADWNVNTARSNRFFAECNKAVVSSCRPPSELFEGDNNNNNSGDNYHYDNDYDGALLVGSDGFRPPSSVRGDVARAILYMGLRYRHLKVTDCPNNDGDDTRNQMAYLSNLLEWHRIDPPTDAEKARNDRVCSRWQGNRNPFVDYPELAETLYRDLTSSSCDDGGVIETPPPVPSPGDVMVAAVQSDNPDIVTLVALADLPSGLAIHVTDNAHDGIQSFKTNEGTVSLILPENVEAGTVFGYGPGLLYGSSWSSEFDRGFALSAAGDTIIVYCTETVPAAGSVTDHDDRTYLSALSFKGPFEESGQDAYGTSSSSVPASIVDYSVALNHRDNYKYVGPTTGEKEALQGFLVDEANWEGSHSKTSSFIPPDFDVV